MYVFIVGAIFNCTWGREDSERATLPFVAANIAASAGQGIAAGAMNTRILTLDQLTAARTKGDVTPFIDTYIYFDCSAVSGAVYQHSTPLNF